MGFPAPLSELMDVASHLCHGREGAVFCLRCTGVWAGAALSLPLVILSARRTPGWLWLLLGACFLQMPVLGYGKVSLPETVKALSGQLFSLSALWFLLLNTTRLLSRGLNRKSAAKGFLIISGAAIALLQVLVRSRSETVLRILDLLCLTGIIAAAFLAAWALLLIGLGLTRRPGD